MKKHSYVDKFLAQLESLSRLSPTKVCFVLAELQNNALFKPVECDSGGSVGGGSLVESKNKPSTSYPSKFFRTGSINTNESCFVDKWRKNFPDESAIQKYASRNELNEQTRAAFDHTAASQKRDTLSEIHLDCVGLWNSKMVDKILIQQVFTNENLIVVKLPNWRNLLRVCTNETNDKRLKSTSLKLETKIVDLIPPAGKTIKLALQIYPNGIGKSLGECVSAYVKIISSPSKTYTLTFFVKSNAKKLENISKSISVDGSLNLEQLVGIQELCNHKELDGFLKKDCLMIGLKVH